MTRFPDMGSLQTSFVSMTAACEVYETHIDSEEILIVRCQSYDSRAGGARV